MNTRVALVTGGIGGLGIEICRHLAHSGHQVIAADLPQRSERLAEFEREVSAAGLDIAFRPLDVRDRQACKALVASIRTDFGRLDVLVNAAGITRDATLRKLEPEAWDAVLSVNLDGVYNITRPALEPMLEQGYGRIINISSVNGQTGQFGQTNYAAAKAGMHGFTMALAREVARKGVTVNSVSPGYCETQLVMAIAEPIRQQIVAQIPVGRLGRPSEIARTVAFLADPESGFITGANIPVNGGYYMA